MHISDVKTGSGRRTIDVEEETVEVLRQWRKEREQEIGGPIAEDALVFTKADGDWVHPDIFSQIFDRVVGRIDVPVITLHDLRHTHATLLLQAGVPVKVVCERLGHSNPAFTMSVYQHVLPGMQAEAAVAFAQVLRNAHMVRINLGVPASGETGSAARADRGGVEAVLKVVAAIDDPAVAAEIAAEAVRAVNRLTLAPASDGAPGWECVSDLYRVLGELRVLTDRLPQAFDQLARHLERPAVDGGGYKCDAGTAESPERLVAAAVLALEGAQLQAAEAGHHLNAAHSAVAHLYP